MPEKKSSLCRNGFCRRSKGEENAPCFVVQTIYDQAKTGAQSRPGGKWDPESWNALIRRQTDLAIKSGCDSLGSVLRVTQEVKPPLEE